MNENLATIETVSSRRFIVRKEGRDGSVVALRAEESFGGFLVGVSTASAGEEAFREFAHAILAGLADDDPDALESEAARLIDRANALRPAPEPLEEWERELLEGCPFGCCREVRPAEPEPVVEGPDLPVRYPHTLQPGDLVEVLPHAFSPYVGVEFEVRDVKRGADPLVSRYFVVGDGVEGGVWADGVALIEPRFYVGEQASGAPAVFDRLVPGSFAPFSFEDSARLWAENLNAGEYGRERLSWIGA